MNTNRTKYTKIDQHKNANTNTNTTHHGHMERGVLLDDLRDWDDSGVALHYRQSLLTHTVTGMMHPTMVTLSQHIFIFADF